MCLVDWGNSDSHLIPPLLTFWYLVARLGRPQQCPLHSKKPPQPGWGEKLKSSFAPQLGRVRPATARARPPRPPPPALTPPHFFPLLVSLPQSTSLPLTIPATVAEAPPTATRGHARPLPAELASLAVSEVASPRLLDAPLRSGC
jgi:hypothetical protein